MQLVYLYPLFGNSPTGYTGQWIFTFDGSNDADSRKDVPFRRFLTLLSIYGVKFPQIPTFGA